MALNPFNSSNLEQLALKAFNIPKPVSIFMKSNEKSICSYKISTVNQLNH